MMTKPMLEIGASLAGRYHIELTRENGDIINYGWHDNMILDSGIELLYTSDLNVMYTVHIGGSNIPPSAGQTALDSPIEHKVALMKNGNELSNYTSGYVTARATAVFQGGVTPKVIKEVGVSPVIEEGFLPRPLFSRAVPKDDSGNDITITLNNGEKIRVEYELRTWWKLPDTPQAITYVDGDGVTRTTTATYNLFTAFLNQGFYKRNEVPFQRGRWIGNEGEFEVAIPFNTETDPDQPLAKHIIKGTTGGALGVYPPPEAELCSFSPLIKFKQGQTILIAGKITLSRRATL